MNPKKKFAQGKNAEKKVTTVKKKAKKILEFYYMSPKEMTAKEMSLCIKSMPEDAVEVWTQLNLMEVVMENDSLIFQDGRECFEDPLDLEFIEKNGIKSIYQMSYDEADQECVIKVMKEILTQMDGMVCCDTDDFEPIYKVGNIHKIKAY